LLVLLLVDSDIFILMFI